MGATQCGRNDAHNYRIGHKSVHRQRTRSKRTRPLSAHLTITTVIAGLAAGCSVTDYKEPIGELQTAIETSIDTVNALDAKATAARNARWRAGITEGKILLSETDGQCADGARACTLKIEFPGDPKPRSYPAVTLMPKAKIGLEALRTYVGKLKSIVEADSVGKVTTAANSALGSAQKIEEAIAKANGKESSGTIADFTEPSVAAIGWLVGQYVDYVKYRALAESTRRAQPVVARLASLHKSIGGAITALETADALKAFLAVQERFDSAVDNGKLSSAIVDDYVAAAAGYDVSLNASTAAPLQAFVATHAKLMKQLNREGGVTLADATAAIADLRDRAKALKAVVEGFTEVTEKRRETANGNN